MILIFIIPIYILLNAYILHRIHKWLTACSKRFHSKWFVVPYLTIYCLLALSLLFAFLLPASEFQVLVKRISNYWLGTFLYLLMFIAVADILRLILKRIPGNLTVKLFWENPCGYLKTGTFYFSIFSFIILFILLLSYFLHLLYICLFICFIIKEIKVSCMFMHHSVSTGNSHKCSCKFTKFRVFI